MWIRRLLIWHVRGAYFGRAKYVLCTTSSMNLPALFVCIRDIGLMFLMGVSPHESCHFMI